MKELTKVEYETSKYGVKNELAITSTAKTYNIVCAKQSVQSFLRLMVSHFVW